MNLLSLSQPVIVPVLALGARRVPRIAALRIRASTGADSAPVWRCLNAMTAIVTLSGRRSFLEVLLMKTPSWAMDGASSRVLFVL